MSACVVVMRLPAGTALPWCQSPAPASRRSRRMFGRGMKSRGQRGRAAPGARPCQATSHSLSEGVASTEAGSKRSERGLAFDTGQAFYRVESAQARDLAVLAAVVHKSETRRLDVLDLMSGCGVRAARYLYQANADFVWANDMDSRNCTTILGNLVSGRLGCHPRQVALPGLHKPVTDLACPVSHLEEAGTPVQPKSGSQGDEDQSPASLFYTPEESFDGCLLGSARLSHADGKRLLASAYMAESYFDLIDIDVYGADCAMLGPALDCIRFGGLLYLTSTDGFSSSGKRPGTALASYGAYTRAHPFANEQGLRMLLGAAVREAATRSLSVEPLFSLYSPHGPVFRTMVRVRRAAPDVEANYGFIGHCHMDGSTHSIPFRSLGSRYLRQRCSGDISVAGPLWTGPLHSGKFLQCMQEQAAAWGWTGFGTPAAEDMKRTGHQAPRPLEVLLQVLEEEADPRLPPWYLRVEALTRFCGVDHMPKRDSLIEDLRKAGHAAACSHVETRAIKTDATIAEVAAVCNGRSDVQNKGQQ